MFSRCKFWLAIAYSNKELEPTACAVKCRLYDSIHVFYYEWDCYRVNNLRISLFLYSAVCYEDVRMALKLINAISRSTLQRSTSEINNVSAVCCEMFQRLMNDLLSHNYVTTWLEIRSLVCQQLITCGPSSTSDSEEPQSDNYDLTQMTTSWHQVVELKVVVSSMSDNRCLSRWCVGADEGSVTKNLQRWNHLCVLSPFHLNIISLTLFSILTNAKSLVIVSVRCLPKIL